MSSSNALIKLVEERIKQYALSQFVSFTVKRGGKIEFTGQLQIGSIDEHNFSFNVLDHLRQYCAQSSDQAIIRFACDRFSDAVVRRRDALYEKVIMEGDVQQLDALIAQNPEDIKPTSDYALLHLALRCFAKQLNNSENQRLLLHRCNDNIFSIVDYLITRGVESSSLESTKLPKAIVTSETLAAAAATEAASTESASARARRKETLSKLQLSYGTASHIRNTVATESFLPLTDSEGVVGDGTTENLTPLLYLVHELGSQHADSAVARDAEAAEAEACEMVKLLVKRGANINAADSRGHTALMLAAINARPQVFRTLLILGSELQAQNKLSENVLHVAVKSFSKSKGSAGFAQRLLRIIRMLVERVPRDESERKRSDNHFLRINHLNRSGWNALHVLVTTPHAHPDAIDLLCGHPDSGLGLVHPSSTDSSSSSSTGSSFINANALTHTLRSCLQEALYHHDSCTLDIVSRLVKNGADVNMDQGTAVHGISGAGLGGGPPLAIAVLHLKSPEIAYFLLCNGAVPPQRFFAGMSPLHIMVHYFNRVFFVKKMLESGADPNAQDSFGRSAVHAAVEGFKPMILLTLLEHGGDLTLRDKQGATPFSIAPPALKSILEEFLYETKMPEIQSTDNGSAASFGFAPMFASEELSDVAVVVRVGSFISRTFPAHKLILSLMSDYFYHVFVVRGEYDNNSSSQSDGILVQFEPSANTVLIQFTTTTTNEADDASVQLQAAEMVLRFLYTGRLTTTTTCSSSSSSIPTTMQLEPTKANESNPERDLELTEELVQELAAAQEKERCRRAKLLRATLALLSEKLAVPVLAQACKLENPFDGVGSGGSASGGASIDALATAAMKHRLASFYNNPSLSDVAFTFNSSRHQPQSQQQQQQQQQEKEEDHEEDSGPNEEGTEQQQQQQPQQKKILGHKVLFHCRCDYFRGMLQSGLEEGSNGTVVIKDMTYGAFEALAKFFYTDELEINLKNAVELTYLSHKLLLDRVRDESMVFLMRVCSLENAADLLQISVDLELKLLNNFVTNYAAFQFGNAKRASESRDQIVKLLGDAALVERLESEYSRRRRMLSLLEPNLPQTPVKK